MTRLSLGEKTVLLGFLILILGSNPVRASTDRSRNLQNLRADICHEESGPKENHNVGSCFAITPGIVVMTYHQTTGDNHVHVLFPGGLVEGRAIFFDPRHDLSFIKVSPKALGIAGAIPIPLAGSGLTRIDRTPSIYFLAAITRERQTPLTIRSAHIEVYMPIVAYKNLGESRQTFSCHLQASILLDDDKNGVIPGMSGGPVVVQGPKASGSEDQIEGFRAIGITSLSTGAQGSATFVPSEVIKTDYEHFFGSALPNGGAVTTLKLPAECAFNRKNLLE